MNKKMKKKTFSPAMFWVPEDEPSLFRGNKKKAKTQKCYRYIVEHN